MLAGPFPVASLNHDLPLLGNPKFDSIRSDDALARDPEKWEPVFGKDHAQNKNLERDDDSKKNHPALARGAADLTGVLARAVSRTQKILNIALT
jgi:hypothetical protein